VLGVSCLLFWRVAYRQCPYLFITGSHDVWGGFGLLTTPLTAAVISVLPKKKGNVALAISPLIAAVERCLELFP